MRFGIDLDGVVANHTRAQVRIINRLWPGRLPDSYEPTSWEWSEVLTPADLDHVWRVIKNTHNFWMTLDAYGDSVRAIAQDRIHHPEDEIYFVTARVPTAGMPPMHQSQAWLQGVGVYGLGTGVIVNSSGDKSDIYAGLEVDATIDDRLTAVVAHAKHNPESYLLDRPWNWGGRPQGIKVVPSLGEFFAKVRHHS